MSLPHFSFPTLIQQITANFCPKRYMLSYSATGPESKTGLTELKLREVSRAGFLAEALRENLFLASSSSSSLSLLHSLGLGSLPAKTSNNVLNLLPPSPPFKDPCDYIGLTHVIQDNLPNWRSADSYLSSICNVNATGYVTEHIHSFWWLGCGHF